MFVPLMYHLIDDTPLHPMVISKNSFDQQLKLIDSLGIPVSSAKEATADMRQGHSRQGIVLTFDDGYKNTTTYVANRLDKYGYPATMAVNSSCLFPETTPKDLPHVSQSFANVADVEKWLSEGRDIAGHGRNHKKLTRLPLDQLTGEVVEDARFLRSRFGHVDTFCYPFGASNEQVRKSVGNEYDAAFVTDGGSWPTAEEPLAIRRLQVRPEWDISDFEVALGSALEEAGKR